jgi:hypothetical protein
MDINGYTFYTMSQDKKSIYQNSGVRVRAVVNDSHDDDDTVTNTYYGQIEEIRELDYVGLNVALFQCRWVTNGKRAVSKDKYGYVSVDVRVFGYKNEPFVLANDVEKVFYVPDLAKKNWSVVMPKKGLLGLKMLLRRMNTTNLMKFHPLTLHTSPDSWELTKHRTCKATIVKNPYTEIKEEKASLMRCIGGISILFVIYGMWWNLNPTCNIFFLGYYIYSVYILLQFSNMR